MAKVTATAERTIGAPVEKVAAAIADYRETRPKILTEHFSEYEVRSGGSGEGTQVHWKLQATQKRVRDCLMTVTEPRERTIVESDGNSSMVTTWTVEPASGGDSGSSLVRAVTTWDGAGGIGGFFEKTFAPLGLRKIYDGMLANLDREVKQG